MPSNPEARLFLPNDLNVMARVSDISQSGAAITSEHAREGQFPTRPPGALSRAEPETEQTSVSAFTQALAGAVTPSSPSTGGADR